MKCGTTQRRALRYSSSLVSAKKLALRNQPDVLKRRRVWFDGQLNLDPEQLIFIDESVLQRHGRSSV
ncbi:hypothetical protein RHEC894_PC00332 (plasmid) [Rhizobium sp. CIAT894]|nr:hypothetical protein RHEC894_PC00332 [Rhizobium sp. CIAT894]